MDLRSSSVVKQRPKGPSSSKPDWVYADETVTAGPPELKQRHPGKSGSDGEDGGSPVRHNVTLYGCRLNCFDIHIQINN